MKEGTKMKTLCFAVLTLVMAMWLSSSASAQTVYYQDDFENYTVGVDALFGGERPGQETVPKSTASTGHPHLDS